MHAYLIALIAITCYASLGVLAKKVQLDIPPFTFITITMLFLAAFSAIAAFMNEKTFSIASMPANIWAWMALFAFINFSGFSLYLHVLGKMPVVEYQIIAVITPIIGGILAFFILSEAITIRYFIGLAFIAVGLYISLKK